jgi:hypothetical protein
VSGDPASVSWMPSSEDVVDDEKLPSNFDTDAELSAAMGPLSHEQGWEGLEPIPPGRNSEKSSIR